MDDDANDFLIFVAIARAGGLAGAAAALNLPKSTVSRRLNQLEERLGSRLVNRTTRKLTLTELGEATYEHALKIEASVSEARAFIAAATSRPQGVLRISAPADFAIWILSDALATFTAANPDLNVEIDCTPRRVDLVGERYDVALRIGKLDSSSLVARHLVSIHRGLYASPRYIAARSAIMKPVDLSEHKFVQLEAQADGRVLLTRRNRDEDIKVGGAITSNSLGSLVALGASGAGIVVVPNVMAQCDVEAGRLVRVLPEWAPAPMEAHYVIPAKKLLPAKTRLFVEHLVAWYGSKGRNKI